MAEVVTFEGILKDSGSKLWLWSEHAVQWLVRQYSVLDEKQRARRQKWRSLPTGVLHVTVTTYLFNKNTDIVKQKITSFQDIMLYIMLSKVIWMFSLPMWRVWQNVFILSKLRFTVRGGGSSSLSRRVLAQCLTKMDQLFFLGEHTEWYNN